MALWASTSSGSDPYAASTAVAVPDSSCFAVDFIDAVVAVAVGGKCWRACSRRRPWTTIAEAIAAAVG